jgi:hypothetical protein
MKYVSHSYFTDIREVMTNNTPESGIPICNFGGVLFVKYAILKQMS